MLPVRHRSAPHPHSASRQCGCTRERSGHPVTVGALGQTGSPRTVGALGSPDAVPRGTAERTPCQLARRDRRTDGESRQSPPEHARRLRSSTTARHRRSETGQSVLPSRREGPNSWSRRASERSALASTRRREAHAGRQVARKSSRPHAERMPAQRDRSIGPSQSPARTEYLVSTSIRSALASTRRREARAGRQVARKASRPHTSGCRSSETGQSVLPSRRKGPNTWSRRASEAPWHRRDDACRAAASRRRPPGRTPSGCRRSETGRSVLPSRRKGPITWSRRASEAPWRRDDAHAGRQVARKSSRPHAERMPKQRDRSIGPSQSTGRTEFLVSTSIRSALASTRGACRTAGREEVLPAARRADADAARPADRSFPVDGKDRFPGFGEVLDSGRMGRRGRSGRQRAQGAKCSTADGVVDRGRSGRQGAQWSTAGAGGAGLDSGRGGRQ